MTDRSKRKMELQAGFDNLFRNKLSRDMGDAPLYAYVLYEELGYELKFDFYENEYQIFADGEKMGSCLNLWGNAARRDYLGASYQFLMNRITKTKRRKQMTDKAPEDVTRFLMFRSVLRAARWFAADDECRPALTYVRIMSLNATKLRVTATNGFILFDCEYKNRNSWPDV